MSEWSDRSTEYVLPSTDSETEDSGLLESTCKNGEKDGREDPYDEKLDWTENRDWGRVHDEERKERRQVYYRAKT